MAPLEPSRTLPLARLVALLALILAPRLANAADQRAILTLSLNHTRKGEVTVVLRDGDVLIAPEDLAAAGLHGLGGRNVEAYGRKFRSLTSLSPPLSFEVDEAALALRIVAPARMLPITVVRLARSAPAGLERRSDASAFLNYGVRASYPLALDGFVDAGLSFDGGNLLSTTATASSRGGVVRGLTSFTVDDQPNMRRWVVGDAFVSGGALGAGTFMGGLSVTKTFAIDPYFIHTPSLGYSGSTASPAVLDVYVNGVLVKSQMLPPGPFQVQSLQAPTGAGNVRYVVRDIFGRQEAVSSPYYASATALAAGLSEYTYAVGATRTNVGVDSFHYGTAGLLIRHRYGVTDHVTAGVRFEGAVGLVSGGPSLTLTLPVGQVDLEGAVSATTDGAGAAGLAGYTFVGSKLGCGVLVRAVSDRYATLGLAAADDRERLRATAFTQVAAGQRVSVGAEYALALDRDRGTAFHVGTTVVTQITRRLSLALGIGRGVFAAAPPAFDASATLSLALEHGVNASAGARVEPGTREAYVDVNKPLPASTGLGYRVYGVLGQAPSILASGQYQGAYGRYQLTTQASSAGSTAELEAAGALVWVRGAGVLPTRPVQDGFAVIRVPDARGVRGFLNNQEIGRTNGSGELVLPALLPYYGNRVAIADADISIERGIDTVEKVIAPAYRGGALVLFEAKRVRFVRGRVIAYAGAVTHVPAYGELTVHGPAGDVTSPLGAQGEFELFGVSVGRYKARMVYSGGTCAFSLRVPASERFIVDVGELRCGPSSKATGRRP